VRTDSATVGAVAEYTTLCHCTDAILAEKIQSSLAAAGLTSRVVGAQRDSVLGGTGAFVGLRIVVLEGELAQAESILEELEGPWANEDEDGADDAYEDEGEDDEDESENETANTPSLGMLYVAKRFSWPSLALGAAVLLFRGRHMEAGFALVFALMAWGVSRPSANEDGKTPL
jgi:hypothetical protein